MIDMSILPEHFERAFIAEVIRSVDKIDGLNHARFARLVWGDEDSSVVKWRRIRNGYRAGRQAQSISLADSCRIAAGLGLPLSSLIFRIERMCEEDAVENRS